MERSLSKCKPSLLTDGTGFDLMLPSTRDDNEAASSLRETLIRLGVRRCAGVWLLSVFLGGLGGVSVGAGLCSAEVVE